MDRDTACKLLRLDASATPDEIEAAFERQSRELDRKIASAGDDDERAEYRAAHEALARAVETLRDLRAASTRTHALPELREGSVFAGRFELRSRVGGGELSTTFSAWDRERGIEVALRVFFPDVVNEPGAIDRLTAAAGAAEVLSHPGIVQVLETVRDQAVAIVSVLPTGRTLRCEIDDHDADGLRFEVDEVTHIGRAVCAALDHAHPGVVHGGVKPENVFLCDDGTVKLADFGVDAAIDIGAPSHVGVTRRQVAYLAPEQLIGGAGVDHRTDQYATAAVLYEMLTRQPPIGRVSAASYGTAEIPKALSQTLDRALAADPEDRFADMDEFAAALAKAARTSARRTPRWAVPVIVLAAIVGALAVPSWRSAVQSTILRALRDPQAQVTAERARTQALAAASAWREVAEASPSEELDERTNEANDALAEAERYLADEDYDAATAAFSDARKRYEALSAERRTREVAPAKDAQVAEELFARLNASERTLYGRAAEAFMRAQRCQKKMTSIPTGASHDAAEAACREARTEFDVLDRLKSLAYTYVLAPSIRESIADALRDADRLAAEGREKEAEASYAASASRLEGLLAWIDLAEAALRDRAVAAGQIEQLQSGMGPMASALDDVQAARRDVEARMSAGDESLEAGQVSEALGAYAAVRAGVADVRARAVAGLFALARSHAEAGRPATAMDALRELFALDPDHAAGRQLAAEIRSQTLINSVGMQLVFLPPGTFMMGSPPDELGRDDDEGYRQVEIKRGFYMGATEVTREQWYAVMNGDAGKPADADKPIDQVAWEAAIEFCDRLSEREKRVYRLPTEEEWEYACRAGTTTPFAFGSTLSSEQANFDGESAYSGETKGIFRGETTPVGMFPPNAWGLYDMHGNVWEWCPDSRKDYPPSPVRRPDEAAPIEGRVLRGGSWRSRARYCRCANRVRETDGVRLDNIGLRVILESE